MKTTFEGSQFRVILEVGEAGYKCSSGIYATIETEDDGNWFPIDKNPDSNGFDAFWLRDLAVIARQAHDGFVDRAKRDGRWPYAGPPGAEE